MKTAAILITLAALVLVACQDMTQSQLGTPQMASGIITPPSGLVSWWPGDGHANDLVGGNHGTLVGATFAAGEVKQAFSFDGTGSHVVFPHNSALNPGTGSYTFDAWVKPEATPGSGAPNDREIADKHSVGGTTPSVWLIKVLPNGRVAATVRDNDRNIVNVASPTAIPNGVFSHVAFVIDRTSDLLRLYVNGAEVASVSIAAVGDISNTKPVIIGNGFINCPGCANPTLPPIHGPFGGEIDEVEIFNRALTAAEIQAMFEAGKAGKQAPPVCVLHKGRTIRLNAAALQAHLAHGDVQVACS